MKAMRLWIAPVMVLVILLALTGAAQAAAVLFVVGNDPPDGNDQNLIDYLAST